VTLLAGAAVEPTNLGVFGMIVHGQYDILFVVHGGLLPALRATFESQSIWLSSGVLIIRTDLRRRPSFSHAISGAQAEKRRRVVGALPFHGLAAVAREHAALPKGPLRGCGA
jgi:hypothetical protein